MTNKIYYDWQQIERWCQRIALDILKTDWRPDYIVGITRGGLVPATILSHLLDIKMHSLDVSLRHGSDSLESNCWMAEDAFGYPDAVDPVSRKNILIVDDINDTGATISWIKNDWQSNCCPKETETWKSIWNQSVRFAVVVNNLASNENINWCATDINKEEDPSWIVFPWEA